ncbi:sirohydrochlorin chelatase [Leptolyngbya sp. PCC 6406]|uniref:sirohydrochlorin chelatase n=1 Tax=Leptolyngbya sp. PCC 6406 TaxID=1173264 RepID=UPI0002ABAF1F|nr:CbiX/SirB N-terminal domain-containing protein [Leptolyngbya sp. PCC 6406]
MSTAYLLVAHGSTDPRHRKSLMRLAQTVRQQLADPAWVGRQGQPMRPEHPEGMLSRWPRASPGGGPRRFPLPPESELLVSEDDGRQHPMPLVGTATLETAAVPLAEQIAIFGHRAAALGVRQLVVVPLFLLRGVHVVEDVPSELAQAQIHLPADMQVHMTDHLGGYQGLQAFLASRLARTTVETRLLVAHGSRRPGSNRLLERTAAKLGAAIAFWAVAPGLEEQVIHLIQAGHQRIAIAPYFLFAGGITDSITQQTEALAERFPRVRFRLLPPLGSSADLARVVSDVALTAPPPLEQGNNISPVLLGNGITA